MDGVDLEGKTPTSLGKSLIVKENEILIKAINYGVKVRFLSKDEFDLFLDLYRETG